jgi:DNA repair photolyase
LEAGRVSFKIIYEPSGRAREYGDLALNIYNSCNFACTYCYVPNVLHVDRETFHKAVKVRDNLLEKVEKDCQLNLIEGRRVHLCFTCDPYQDIDLELQTTREVLKLFKKYNVNFQILTKGGMRATRDFDLYKPGDSFGSTLTFDSWNLSLEFEPNAARPLQRIRALKEAHDAGIKTWVSLEPVIIPEETLAIIENTYQWIDLYKIGTINYSERKKEIDWKDFGRKAIELLERYGKEYYIKDDLRKEMER